MRNRRVCLSTVAGGEELTVGGECRVPTPRPGVRKRLHLPAELRRRRLTGHEGHVPHHGSLLSLSFSSDTSRRCSSAGTRVPEPGAPAVMVPTEFPVGDGVYPDSSHPNRRRQSAARPSRWRRRSCAVAPRLERLLLQSVIAVPTHHLLTRSHAHNAVASGRYDHARLARTERNHSRAGNWRNDDRLVGAGGNDARRTRMRTNAPANRARVREHLRARSTRGAPASTSTARLSRAADEQSRLVRVEAKAQDVRGLREPTRLFAVGERPELHVLTDTGREREVVAPRRASVAAGAARSGPISFTAFFSGFAVSHTRMSFVPASPQMMTLTRSPR